MEWNHLDNSIVHSASVNSFRTAISKNMTYDFCQRKSFQECFQSLKHCFGDQSPTKTTVFSWFRQFMSGERTLEDHDRYGRMSTTVTPENVPRVESLIKKEQKMAYAEIQGIMKISSGSLTRIVHDCLVVKKRCACWVPLKVSEEQKQGRVDWCTHMPRQFDRGRSPRVWNIVTGDETWVYQYDPETKQQSAVWVFPDEKPPVKFKTKQKCFQTNDSVFLCKIRPRCHYAA